MLSAKYRVYTVGFVDSDDATASIVLLIRVFFDSAVGGIFTWIWMYGVSQSSVSSIPLSAEVPLAIIGFIVPALIADYVFRSLRDAMASWLRRI